MKTTSPYIIDTTLRDGAQAPGVVFSLDEKINIAGMLNDIGVDEIEAGTPAIGLGEVSYLKTLTRQGFHLWISAWCRAMKRDIDAAVKSGVPMVNISFPVSHTLLDAMSKDDAWLWSTMHEIIPYAKQRFEFVNIGLQDATRCDLVRIKSVISQLATHSVGRIRIADTVGILNPMTTMQWCNDLGALFPLQSFELHAHNDLGMATANTITAISCGFDCFSATVNGVGERAGNAAFEEVVMGLTHTCDTQLKIKTQQLTKLSEYVATASGRSISPDKPIVGELILTHESGIHTRALVNNPKAYQPFLGHEIGTNTDFRYGKHSGKSSIQQLLLQYHIQMNDNEISTFLDEVKILSEQHKRSFTATEVMNLMVSRH